MKVMIVGMGYMLHIYNIGNSLQQSSNGQLRNSTVTVILISFEICVYVLAKT